jgi:ketosteroid isomerase-like protein
MEAQTFQHKEQIIAHESRLLNAIKASDVSTLDELLHDDLLFITPGGQAITKAMDLDAHRSGSMVVDEILPDLEHINVIGDTAVVTLTLDTKGKMLGQPIAGKFRYIRVWKLFGDRWKVIGGSCTQL